MLSSAYAASPVAKVSVLANGQVFLKRAPTTLKVLDATFAQLSLSAGVVWYYREAAATDRPPNAIEIIELIVKHRLPIRMSTKADFSLAET